MMLHPMVSTIDDRAQLRSERLGMNYFVSKRAELNDASERPFVFVWVR